METIIGICQKEYELKGTLDKLLKENIHYMEIIKELKDENEELKDENEELKEATENKNKNENKKLRIENEKLKRENNKILKKISQFKDENEKLKGKSNKNLKKISQYKEENAKLKQKIEDLKEATKAENNEENEELLKEISQYKEENEELKQKIEQANKALENISHAVDNAYEHREHRNHEENIKSIKCFIDYIKRGFYESKQTQLYVFATETETERHCKVFEDIKELNKDEENYKESPRTIAKINVSLIDVVNKFIELEKHNIKYPYIIYDMFQLFTTDNDFTPLEITKMIIEEFLNKYEYHHDL